MSEKDCLARVGLAGGDGEDFLALTGPYSLEGQRRRLFKKGIISTGTYVHPLEGWKLKVTRRRLDHWIAAFNRMRTGGVDVEVVVDHSLKAEAVRGYVVNLFREGNWLCMTAEMRGAEGIRLAQTVRNVSLMIAKDFTDGTGRHYGEAISHVAIVQQPVVPGQSEFEAVAASRSGVEQSERIPILSRDHAEEPMDTERLQEILGVDEVTEEDAMDRVAETVEALRTDAREKDEMVLALRQELEAGQASDPTPEVDPEALDLMAEAADVKLSALVEKGKVTPAVRDELAHCLIGGAGRRNAYVLSRRASEGDRSLFAAVVDALEKNDVVKLGEQTGRQVVEFARVTPGETPRPSDPKERRRRGQVALGAAGMTQKA